MMSTDLFQLAKNSVNGPPGLIHPLLQEHYSWVDNQLQDLYYGYALTPENCDEYDECGLLNEKYAWVDQKLEEMCIYKNKPYCPLRYSCPPPITWLKNRYGSDLRPLEDDCVDVDRGINAHIYYNSMPYLIPHENYDSISYISDDDEDKENIMPFISVRTYKNDLMVVSDDEDASSTIGCPSYSILDDSDFEN